VQTAPTLPDAKYGEHQYSNLGYALLGLAMEAAYDEKKSPAQSKDYKQLMHDYMLEPIEGRAAESGLQFDSTKFPQDLSPEDNFVHSKWLEGDKLADATKFSGANSAGGMLASADDSAKFFNNFFKGFPGTPAEQNPFFSQKTIDAMTAETHKFPSCSPDGRAFQGPGFVMRVDENGKPATYSKGGATYGHSANLTFDVHSGAQVRMCAQENVTAVMATGLTASTPDTQDMIRAKTTEMIDKYRDESGEYNRSKMLESEMPKQEITAALHDAVEALQDNEASVSGADEARASSLAGKDHGDHSRQ